MTASAQITDPYTVVCDQSDRAHWLEERQKGLGASDAPAILGLSRFASPLSVGVSKLGLEKDPEQESELLAWGREIERPLTEKFARDTGRRVELDGRLLRSNDLGWMLATRDAVQWDDDHEGPGVLECKLAIYSADDWKEGIPDSVDAQMQHQMAVSGCSWGSAVALLHGYQVRFQDVLRDDDFILNVLIPAEARFWAKIEARDLSGLVDDTEATAGALKLLYPEDGDGKITVQLDGQFTAHHLRRLEIKEQAKTLETELRGIDNTFKDAIGGATFATLPNGVTYSLKTTHRKGYEVKRTSYRTLRVVGGKK